VLYGIGARFDEQPELLFRLHEVDQEELIAKAGKALPLSKVGPSASKILGSDDLSGIFGLDMAEGTGANAGKAKPRKLAGNAARGKKTRRKRAHN
jgi:hypothetical protein